MLRNCLICLFALMAIANSKVIEIKDDKEFKNLLKSDDFLAKFYAPWCGHCKKLAPEFISAEKEISTNKVGNVKMVKVDCTSDKLKDTCQKYEVKGYPTLKYFGKSAKAPIDYNGHRDKEGLVSFVKKIIQDVVLFIKSQQHLDDLVKENKIVVVEFAKNENSKKFKQVAEDLRLHYTFGIIKDDEFAKSHEIPLNGISIFRSFDDPKVHFDSKKSKLADWIDHHSFPLIGEMSPETYTKYMGKDLPVVWFAVDKKDQKTFEKLLTFSHIFRPLKEKILATYVDTNQFKEALSMMGFGEKYPSILIINKQHKYKFNGDFEAAQVQKFVEDFLAKKLPKFYRSEAPPKNNEGPITEIVGDTFKKFVMDEEVDVLLEFYLSYCQHCKKFEPDFIKLGELYQNEKFFKIGKINGEKNDTPHEIKGYPSLILFRAGKKDEPLVYDGDFNADAVEQWLAKNSPLLSKRPEQKEAPKKTDEKSKSKSEL